MTSTWPRRHSALSFDRRLIVVATTPQIVGGAHDIIWIYAVGPAIGAVLATFVALFIFGKPREGERKAAPGK